MKTESKTRGTDSVASNDSTRKVRADRPNEMKTRIQNSSAAGQEDDPGQSQERGERDHQRVRVWQDKIERNNS